MGDMHKASDEDYFSGVPPKVLPPPTPTSDTEKNVTLPMTAMSVTSERERDENESRKTMSMAESRRPPAPESELASRATDESRRGESVAEEQIEAFKMDVNEAALLEEDKLNQSLWAAMERDELFHGTIPTDDVKLMLQQDGDFLLRRLEDEKSKEVQYVLTVRYTCSDTKQALYYNIPFTLTDAVVRREYTLNLYTTSATPQDLVRLHVEKNIPVHRDIVAKKGIVKQEWELSKEHINLIAKIGEGAFGEVWKGTLKRQTGTPIDVAVKLMKVSNCAGTLSKMQAEARMMRQFNHGNVVKLHGILFSDADVMIVMEMVSGGGLDSYLKKHKELAILNRASYSYDVASGLAYLHSKNWMHRDVAARNCLVTSTGRMIKLSDFGMSVPGKRYNVPSEERVPVRWQSPEVLLHRIYVRESDVWSYGMLVWEIFNEGKPPFTGIENAKIRQNIALPTFRPALDFKAYPEIYSVLTKCWDVDTRKRPSMTHIAEYLGKYCIHSTVTQKETEERFVGRKKKRNKSGERVSQPSNEKLNKFLSIPRRLSKTRRFSKEGVDATSIPESNTPNRQGGVTPPSQTPHVARSSSRNSRHSSAQKKRSVSKSLFSSGKERNHAPKVGGAFAGTTPGPNNKVIGVSTGNSPGPTPKAGTPMVEVKSGLPNQGTPAAK